MQHMHWAGCSKTDTWKSVTQVSGLHHFELLVEKAEDSRVLLAWGLTSVVLSFRGTSSWTNIKADLSAWLSGGAM